MGVVSSTVRTSRSTSVLVVEDDDADFRSVVRALRSAQRQFRVERASTLAAAITALRARVFDCALVDYRLPDGLGTDLLPVANATPVVMLTGAQEQKLPEQVLERGAQDYVGKNDYSAPVLTRVIDYAIYRHRAQRELSRQSAELSRSNRLLQRFADMAVHDLRSPLRHLTINAQLVQQSAHDGLDAETLECLEEIATSSTRMREVVEGLGQLSRAKSGSLSVETCAIESIVEQAWSNVALEVKERDAEILFESEPPQVQGNESLLIVLFQNLFANAIKFCPQDRAPQIRVDSTVNGEDCEIYVSDNGCGIGAENAEQIFEPFSRLSSEVEGTGLGLATCWEIVHRHQGRIWVVPDHSAGAKIGIALPRHQ